MHSERKKLFILKIRNPRFDDVAYKFPEVLNFIGIPQTYVKADIPATTRDLGFNTLEAFETDNTISPGATAATQIVIHVAYCVALLHLKVQQQITDQHCQQRRSSTIEDNSEIKNSTNSNSSKLGGPDIIVEHFVIRNTNCQNLYFKHGFFKQMFKCLFYLILH